MHAPLIPLETTPASVGETEIRVGSRLYSVLSTEAYAGTSQLLGHTAMQKREKKKDKTPTLAVGTVKVTGACAGEARDVTPRERARPSGIRAPGRLTGCISAPFVDGLMPFGTTFASAGEAGMIGKGGS